MPTALQRLTAALLLMAYAVTGTSMMPALMAAMAWIDGGHSVMVVQSEQGTRVTLQHHDHEYTPAVQDHGSPLVRMIVSMCSASETGDHQLTASSFESGTRLERDDQAALARRAPELNPSATFRHGLALHSMHGAAGLPAEKLDDPPLNTGPLRTLTTVRLLI